MIRSILTATDPRLRLTSKPVQKIDKKILSLVGDLVDTLAAQKDPEGVGLAAPQIGKNLRVFAIKPEKEIEIFINPKILKQSKDVKTDNKTAKIMEGCLSLVNHYGPLVRSKEIVVEYLDKTGQKHTQTFKDFDAQIVLHEVDHLNGVLFVDRLLESRKPLYELVNDEWYEVEI